MDAPCDSFLNVLSIESLHSPRYYDMVVFSHLRWGNSDNRPKQLLSRLSKDLHILYVEEPIAHHQDDKFTAEIKSINEKLSILRPRVDSIEEIATVLPLYVSNYYIPVGWFYSPIFSVMTEWFSFFKVVYDCMDEISGENGSTERLVQLENELVSRADIVFTLARRTFEAKSRVHDNVYFFPGRTERLHFTDALEGNRIPREFKRLQRPIIGFAGEINKDLDLDLIRNAARLAKAASFVLCGPLNGISKNDLPKAANICYLGDRPENEIQAFTENFDIRMFPLRHNTAPELNIAVNPKTSDKPIIATAVPSFIGELGPSVNLVSNADDFLATVIEILMADELLKRKQESYFEYVLNKNSWNWTAARISKILRSS